MFWRGPCFMIEPKPGCGAEWLPGLGWILRGVFMKSLKAEWMFVAAMASALIIGLLSASTWAGSAARTGSNQNVSLYQEF